jgi:uncharacterized membrane protein (UPF0182 family)
VRTPADFPVRRPRAQRGRIWLVVLAAVLFFLIVSLRGIAAFYTDFLWFDDLRLASVWRGILGAKLALAVIFTIVAAVALWLNLWIAEKLAPAFRPPGPEEEIAERFHEVVGGRTALVRLGFAVLFGLMAGAGASGRWNDWVLFTNHVAFNAKDALFHRDIGFYVFQLPFLSFVVGWAFATLVVVLLLTAGWHYLFGGIRVQTPAIQHVTPQVKAHLSVLLGVIALLKAAGYWLQRFELTTSTRGYIDGAGYTDAKAQLPALQLLVIISVLAALLFLVNIRLRGWTLPVIAVALWGFTSIVVGVAYPAFIQKFRVEPNQSQKERPYIARNIAATRKALNIDDAHVTVKNFAYGTDLDAGALDDNSATIRNVRLWDPIVLRQTYRRLQEIRQFYRFNDVDIDRYQVDGELTQVMLSARELDPGGLLSKTWENTHLNFTHGYGAVLSPANAVTTDGLPDLLLKDLPPVGKPALDQPAVYFGEDLGGYAIVNTKRQEIDYQRADGSTKRTTYKGSGGVVVSSWLRRAALALRFGEINPLISSYITKDSRAIYLRDIHERVTKIAPFLRFDADPYPVVLDGKMFWVQDAYTTTSRYPYAERAPVDRLPSGSGLRERFNYVRNSVKVVTNAYDGKMTFYVVDKKDPIAKAYQKAFPKLFTTAPVPSELQQHLRYPEDMFRVQTDAYGTYHITDPGDFYDRGDAWDIARDPGSGRVANAETASAPAPTTPSGAPAPTIAGSVGSTSGDDRMDPYYLLMRLPDERDESFLILQPFTPASKDLLSAFMVAKSDPAEYGKLEAFVMPRDLSVDGPRIIDGKINQEPALSQEISLLNQSGSKVLNGNLLLIPVNQSLLYIRPLYVEAQGTPVPQLKYVVAVYNGNVEFDTTLRGALTKLFGAAPETLEQPATGGAVTPPPSGGQPPPVSSGVDATVQSLLEQALQAYTDAQSALRSGDLATYQKKIGEMNDLVADARRRLAGPSSSPTTTTTAPASA